MRRALSSVACQASLPDEVLIGDNSEGLESREVFLEWRDRIPGLRYIKRETNIGPASNFLSLVAESSSAYFMWLADDDVLEPTLVSRTLECLALFPGLEYLGWGFRVHNYVAGVTEVPSAIPAVLYDNSCYENTRLFLEMPISSLFYGLYKRNILLQSSLSRWNANDLSFDWMDVAFIMSNLLNYRSHFLPECLATYGIDELVRPVKGAAGSTARHYDPMPWLMHGIVLILCASQLSIFQRIKLLPKFLYAWRNTTSFAINHS
ncbi:glycosyltransferase [Cyanobium sp. AMD-g]|nr:glycosyltransferase [Cyanobium sp. AMD-g]